MTPLASCLLAVLLLPAAVVLPAGLGLLAVLDRRRCRRDYPEATRQAAARRVSASRRRSGWKPAARRGAVAGVAPAGARQPGRLTSLAEEGA